MCNKKKKVKIRKNMKKYKKGRTMRGKKERKIQIFIIFYYLSFSLLNTLE